MIVGCIKMIWQIESPTNLSHDQSFQFEVEVKVMVTFVTTET